MTNEKLQFAGECSTKWPMKQLRFVQQSLERSSRSRLQTLTFQPLTHTFNPITTPAHPLPRLSAIIYLGGIISMLII